MVGNFVFDLDGAIVIALDYYIEATEADLKAKFDDDFINRHSVMALDFKHLVYPGYYALFQWLHNKGAKLFFFSSGIKERNTELVDNLMQKAFGENAKNVDYKVFSRNDCVDTYILEEEDKKKYQSYFFGNYKKKLADIIVPKEELQNTLLIDDDTSYMVKNEEYNFVHVRPTSHYLPYSMGRDEYCHFHPAYYLAGLFSEIFKIQSEKKITLVEAAKYLQIDSRGLVLSRDFRYDFQNVELHKKGLEILREIDASLKFYFEIKTNL